MEFFKKTLDPSIALAIIAAFDIFLFLIVGAMDSGWRRNHDDGPDCKILYGGCD